MNESSVQQRKLEVLSALVENKKLQAENIEVKPINGSGDMEIEIRQMNKYKQHLHTKGVVKYDQDIDHLKTLFYHE